MALFFFACVAIVIWLVVNGQAKKDRIKAQAARDRAGVRAESVGYRSGRVEQVALQIPLPRSVEAPPIAPVVLDAAEQSLMRDHGISLSNGRYVVGGYGFSNLLQAIDYARRRTPGTAAPVSEAATSASGQTAAPRFPARWIAPGEAVQIAQVGIPHGMFYAGAANGAGRWLGERSLIDPSLPIGLSGTDPQGSELPYWPSYRELPKGCRRTYLDWLAGGRTAVVGIGYVFIFFYGLERRLLVDKAFDEAEAIIAEVSRLLTTHAGNYSFEAHARAFLDAAELVRPTAIGKPELSARLGWGTYEFPIATRRYLGGRLAEQAPLDADDCLIWTLSLPDVSLRTPGSRCFEELVALWRIRFARRHPDGLAVRAPKRRLSSLYRSASGSFEIAIEVGDLPDIAAVAGPLAGLKDLLEDCQNELDAYSRLLGRRPEAKGGLEAALCLPDDLLETEHGESVRRLRSDLHGRMGDRPVLALPVREMGALIGLGDLTGKVGIAVQRQFGVVLDRLDIAFEPDRRYGDAALNADGQLVLYRGERGSPVEGDRPAYLAGRMGVEVSALAAASDGEVVMAEVEQIEAEILGAPDLTPAERRRLSAYAFWLVSDTPRQQAAMTRMGKVGLPMRSSVARTAVAAVLADGQVLPAEIRFLEKLYKALGLPQDEVYGALHRGPIRRDEPVTIALAETADGVPLPVEIPVPAGVQFDADRLARIRQETSEVSNLLAGIFREDETEVSAPAPLQQIETMVRLSRFEGLDTAHADLLGLVIDSGAINRDQFDDHARRLRLLPDGALETINDWAFDRFDDPVLEGDEVISAASHLQSRLTAMEHAA